MKNLKRQYLDISVMLTPSYIKRIRAEGFENITLTQLMSFKVFDVTTDDIKKLKAKEGKKISANDVIMSKVMK